jgi:esterase/lipase
MAQYPKNCDSGVAYAEDLLQRGSRTMRRLIALALGWLMLAATAKAETIGIVMLHGKHGTPAQLQQLDETVSQSGFIAERPEMCWSRDRIYDRAYLDCFADIDAAAARLKARGATTIVILGMSLGGNGALGYSARRPGLKGVIALAPASEPDRLRQRPNVAASVAQAQALVAAGKGDERQSFTDLNNGSEFTVTTTPVIFLSFLGKDSPANMPENAAHLTAPLLMVSGSADNSQRDADGIFARAPRDPRNKHVTVQSDHFGTPAASPAAVLTWLKSLGP